MVAEAGYGGMGGVPMGARLAAMASHVPWAAWTTWAGAGTTVVLLAGLTTWAVDLTLRDVREIPVIAAMDAPMRVAPETPGGAQAPHQGLALGEIAAGAAASPAPERVTLAPPPATVDAPPLGARAEAAASQTVLAGLADAPASATDETPDAASDAAAKRSSLSDVVDAAVLSALQSEAAVLTSPRPARRPADLGRRAAAPAVARVDPATVPPSARLVQLATMDSEALAEAEWRRLARRHPDYLDGHAPMIVEARAGGSTFWRLQAVDAEGANGADDARRLCAALSAAGTSCIPVTHR